MATSFPPALHASTSETDKQRADKLAAAKKRVSDVHPLR